MLRSKSETLHIPRGLPDTSRPYPIPVVSIPSPRRDPKALICWVHWISSYHAAAYLFVSLRHAARAFLNAQQLLLVELEPGWSSELDARHTKPRDGAYPELTPYRRTDKVDMVCRTNHLWILLCFMAFLQDQATGITYCPRGGDFTTVLDWSVLSAKGCCPVRRFAVRVQPSKSGERFSIGMESHEFW